MSLWKYFDFSFLKQRTEESETIRGKKAAEKFISSNPSIDEIERQWQNSYECENFSSSSIDKAYDKAWRKVVGPYRDIKNVSI